MTRTNKILIVVAVFMLLITVIGRLAESIGITGNIFLWLCAEFIANFAAFIVLFINSSIRYTVYWKYLVGSFGLVILGSIFLVLRLDGAVGLTLSGELLIVLAYGVRFFNKPRKKVLDILKMLWVVTLGVQIFLRALDLDISEFGSVVSAAFWIMFGWFLFLQWRDSTSP